MVCKDLHVRPDYKVVATLWQEPEHNRIDRVSHLDKGSAILHADDGNLIPSLRVSPAPGVGRHVGAPQLGDGDEGEEVNVAALIVAGHAVLALDLGQVGPVPRALSGRQALRVVLRLELHHVLHAGVVGDAAAVRVLAARAEGRDSAVARALDGVRPLVGVHVAVGEEVGAIVVAFGTARDGNGRGQEQG